MTATQAAPSALFAVDAGANASSAICNAFTPPAGSAAVITSISLSPHGATTANELVSQIIALDGSCGNLTGYVANDWFVNQAPYSDQMGAGIGLKSGHYLGISMTGGTPNNAFIDVIFHGYYVPAAACSTGCL